MLGTAAAIWIIYCIMFFMDQWGGYVGEYTWITLAFETYEQMLFVIDPVAYLLFSSEVLKAAKGVWSRWTTRGAWSRRTDSNSSNQSRCNF